MRHLVGAEQYLSAAQQKQHAEKGLSPAEKLINRANAVDIFDVLEDFFDLRIPRTGDSYKSRCPFYYEHADGGLDKGWRTYPATNSSMCFPMHGYMGPVHLIRNKYGDRPFRAAERILKHYDLLRPKPWWERYDTLALEQAQARTAVGNPQHAVSALNLALRSVSGYTLRQFDSDVLAAMEVVLNRLDEVAQQDDPSAVRLWLQNAKKIMTHVVEKGQG